MLPIVEMVDKVHRSIVFGHFAICDEKKSLLVAPFFTKNKPDLLQENEQYSSDTWFQLTPLTIPYSQLDGGGSNVSGVSWDNVYRHYSTIGCLYSSYRRPT
jgi:hypothetical protein